MTGFSHTRRITMSDEPERFTYSIGDRVAPLGGDGQPNLDNAGTIVGGVWEESAERSDGGSYMVTYEVRVPAGRYYAKELELVDIPMMETADAVTCPDTRCGSKKTTRSLHHQPAAPTKELRQCPDCEMWFWRLAGGA